MEKLDHQLKPWKLNMEQLPRGNDESDDDTDEMEFQKEWAELMSGSEMNLNYQNFTKYSSDPAVQKAMARLNAVLEKIGISDDEENDEDSNEEDYEE
jgi:hypothetical protein